MEQFQNTWDIKIINTGCTFASQEVIKYFRNCKVICTNIWPKNNLRSSCFYKRFNNLLVDSKQNVKVSWESIYDAEMYRILVNWLTKIHGFEIIGQWYLVIIIVIIIIIIIMTWQLRNQIILILKLFLN